jgi:hypothetical protein
MSVENTTYAFQKRRYQPHAASPFSSEKLISFAARRQTHISGARRELRPLRRTRLYHPRPEGMKPVSLLKLALNLDQSALINLTFDPAKEGAGISEQGSVLCEASVLRCDGYFP